MDCKHEIATVILSERVAVLREAGYSLSPGDAGGWLWQLSSTNCQNFSSPPPPPTFPSPFTYWRGYLHFKRFISRRDRWSHCMLIPTRYKSPGGHTRGVVSSSNLSQIRVANSCERVGYAGFGRALRGMGTLIWILCATFSLGQKVRGVTGDVVSRQWWQSGRTDFSSRKTCDSDVFLGRGCSRRSCYSGTIVVCVCVLAGEGAAGGSNSLCLGPCLMSRYGVLVVPTYRKYNWTKAPSAENPDFPSAENPDWVLSLFSTWIQWVRSLD